MKIHTSHIKIIIIIEVTNNELQHDTADYWLAQYQKNLMAKLAITSNSLPLLVALASELRTEIT